MRINYKILWFEDEKSSYKTKKRFVKEIVEEFGFNFVEPQNEVSGDNIHTLNYSQFDLIIADMNLAKGVTAMELMDIIRREKKVFTEVLFYSSEGELAVRKVLANYKIDGAYCSGRDNEDFEYKAREVILTLIKKTQDLTNMRGLVMAEVSELDLLMERIIRKFLSTVGDREKEAFKKNIVGDVEKSLKNLLQAGTVRFSGVSGEGKCECGKTCVHVWNNESVDRIISSLGFESSRKARAIHLIIAKGFLKYNPQRANFFEDYKREIIEVRNKLAHCKSEVVDGNEVLITQKGAQERFDDALFKEIRTNIKKYRDLFQKYETDL
ncbi:MAG: hypothetical protein E7037_04660 [Verrucomicrobia bacterium]|nr:hypothetical protein [Verrucomicrobiota bacterium]